MRSCGLIGLILLCSLAQSAEAGAWARGKGNAFTSTSAIMNWPEGRALELPDIYGSAYAEFGLSNHVTLGLDIGSSDAQDPNKLKAIGFMRYSFQNASARHQLAIDIGGGAYLGQAAMRLGASYAAGFTLFKRSSWVALDWHTLFKPNGAQVVQKLDATIGMSFERGKLMAQISGYRPSAGKSTLTVTPSYAFEFSENLHVDIGLAIDLVEPPNPALSIGVWRKF